MADRISSALIFSASRFPRVRWSQAETENPFGADVASLVRTLRKFAVSHREDIIPAYATCNGASRFQSGSRSCNRTFLHDSGPKQHHGLRLQLRVCPPRPDDGLNFSRKPRHVARRQLAASTYGLLHRHHRLGINHYASMLVGWCSVAEIVSCGQGAIRRYAERRRDCADDEPVDVVGGIPRYRGRMVSDVAVANMEWAGSGIPNVYDCRCGVFSCGATRANSRLVAKPEEVNSKNGMNSVAQFSAASNVVSFERLAGYFRL